VTRSLLKTAIASERDAVGARQRARHIAALMGFDGQDQTRIATAVSELARNAFVYAGGGTVEFRLAGDRLPQSLAVVIADRGPGIAPERLDEILGGRYRSATGMGLGLIGAKRLMDDFAIDTGPGGTTITLRKVLPPRAALVDPARIGAIAAELAREAAPDPLGELQAQNRELLASLEELTRRRDELRQLNTELEDTNRGVVALYAELDEKAESLRRADELKTRFLSNMSHEFRTPVNSILALARMLLGRIDGPLTSEQERQVGFIQQAAQDLKELVDDLLDLAKVEAGKIEIRPTQFALGELFGTLRGMIKPLLTNESVALIFDEPLDLPPLVTDQGKLAQILRNFLSNALKFTEQGHVRVTASLSDDGATLTIAVADTGIGIPQAEQERIFEEFSQVENRLQAKVKGTGLGLSLSRRLAALLGGRIAVQSAPGEGSTFSIVVPRVWPGAADGALASGTVLVIDDDQVARYVLRQSLPGDIRLVEAANGEEGLARAAAERPGTIFLDLNMPGISGFEVLDRLKADPATRAIPVVVSTSKVLEPAERARLAEAAAVLSKADASRETVEAALRRAFGRAGGA